jgi:hypothetical protein
MVFDTKGAEKLTDIAQQPEIDHVTWFSVNHGASMRKNCRLKTHLHRSGDSLRVTFLPRS